MYYKTLVSMLLICCACMNPLEAARNKKRASFQKPTECQPYIAQNQRYYLASPKGWHLIIDKSQLPAKIELIFVGAGKGSFSPSINLATEKTEMGLGDYIALAKKYHESQGETSCHQMGTIQTQEGDSIVLQIDRKTNWGNVRFVQATLIKESTAYVITATCLQEEFAGLYPQFYQAIQSFKVLQ